MKKLLVACQKIEDGLPIGSAERKAVLTLKHDLQRRNSQFNAAGFFPIDRKTIFGLLSVVATYLIIMLQCKDKS